MDEKDQQLKERLLGSLLHFTQVFYKIRTGREFILGTPNGRECHQIAIARELVNTFKGDISRLIINVPPRYGKAIDVNTRIFTGAGWKYAHEIKAGDKLLGSKGWTKVIGVYSQGQISAKKVTFSDNQEVICNADHLWSVRDRYTAKDKTLKTSDIENTLFEADGRKHWRIPLLEGDYGCFEPFVDPYLLGCWLGDGNSYYAGITTMDGGIVKAFTKEGHILKAYKHQNSGKATSYGVSGNGFNAMLRRNNLLGNKHIPAEMFNCNKANRVALLQGLMDTDETCGKNGQVSFTNTNKEILKGCAYLVNSLGGVYRIYKRKNGAETLNIRLPEDIKPFRLLRKQKYVATGVKCSPRRFIKSIDNVSACEMVCFEVDAPDKLFAIGPGLILTHNTEMLIHFIAWSLAHHPDSNFLYISYSHTLAKKQTQTIREIVNLPEYKQLFNVKISSESSAKDDFTTNAGGSVYASGAGGTICGRGAGIMNADHFAGCIVIDDIHKPDEVTSDVMREGIIAWYYNTMQSRLNNGDKTPIIFIGQRLHEADLPAQLLATGNWHSIILPAIDRANNALFPMLHDYLALRDMQKREPYVFASQYQQDPQPAGGGIFKPEWYVYHEIEPQMLATFITVDTAETDKDYNDASVFSFWGVYKIMLDSVETGQYGLHWIDCKELRVEPKDLEPEFLNWYASTLRHPVPPKLCGIEKKSTGVTLQSTLQRMQGIQILGIERTKASGNKTARFLEAQPYVAQGFISFTVGARHAPMCVEHCRKITANDTHAHDDIADTKYDAIKLALIDKIIINSYIDKKDDGALAVMAALTSKMAARKTLQTRNYYG